MSYDNTSGICSVSKWNYVNRPFRGLESNNVTR
jgi:hypothetical protein